MTPKSAAPATHEESTRLKMEAIGRLAGGVAHDFNNLLTVITGCTQLLSEVNPSEEERTMLLNDIAEAANRASTLTRQLLAFSRRQSLQREVVDVSAHLSALSNLLKRLVGEHIRYSFSAAGECGCAKLDPDQFDQVVLNLVVNARDAMPNGGELTVSACCIPVHEPLLREGVTIPPGQYVRIAIRDTGDGIPAPVLPHIFEPFFTTKRSRGGTGLGLATVYGIVKQHGGYIFVDSKEGTGTEFELLFPWTSASAQEAHAPAVYEAAKPGGTILVVEDEPAVAKLAGQLLSSEGYRILEASNGEEALEVLAGHAPNVDLVFTDVVMPRMGGPELAASASRKWTHLAFLFTSGYLGDEQGAHAKLPRGIDLVPKPYTRQALVGKIRAALAGRGRPC